MNTNPIDTVLSRLKSVKKSDEGFKALWSLTVINAHRSV